MVRSLADRTFQLSWKRRAELLLEPRVVEKQLREHLLQHLGSVIEICKGGHDVGPDSLDLLAPFLREAVGDLLRGAEIPGRASLGLLHELDESREVLRDLELHERGDLGDLYAENGQTLQGSFSAVSKPNLQVNTRWKALAEI